jgi:hypothetical protein
MKRSAKNSNKLALQRETLRLLASVELACVVGGGVAAQEANDTHGDKGCAAAEAAYVVLPIG